MHQRLEKAAVTAGLPGMRQNHEYLLQERVASTDKSMFLTFEDVSYSVRTGIVHRERRKLLRNVHGDFRPGELTAIMGPSGAGKSTLMDVLAGFRTSSVSGTISVNGQKRNFAMFRRASAYIMQDNNLQPLLTVHEAMHIAADLKVTLSHQEKLRRIDEILIAMGIEGSRHTRTDALSGGERKRLAIALELINNPPIMFFDEPTSGLDSVTSKQCLGLLKRLAQEGRTVICSIHQPSAMLFYMIDHLYVVADGSCVYTGGARNLVAYLDTQGLSCPTHYNPADFLMEICNGDYGPHVPKLIEAMENGKCNQWRSATNTIGFDNYDQPADDSEGSARPMSPLMRLPSIDTEVEHTTYYATGFWRQLCILLRRNAIKLSRDRVLTYTRLSMHFIIALLVGSIYFRIGQDAAYVLDNFNMLFFSIMFVIFSSFSAALTTFPLELPIVTREHFNRWYKLHSFYLANKLADLPVQLLACTMFTLIVYYMSDQLPEMRRLGLYALMCITVSLVAQAVGLIAGTGMNLQNGMVLGPLLILPFLIFSGFFVHLNDAHPYMHWLFHISFLRYAFEGVMIAIYGYDRAKMRCSEDYCHFALPEKLLVAVDMKHVDYWFCMTVLVGLYIALDVIGFIALRLKLKRII